MSRIDHEDRNHEALETCRGLASIGLAAIHETDPDLYSIDVLLAAIVQVTDNVAHAEQLAELAREEG